MKLLNPGSEGPALCSEFRNCSGPGHREWARVQPVPERPGSVRVRVKRAGLGLGPGPKVKGPFWPGSPPPGWIQAGHENGQRQPFSDYPCASSGTEGDSITHESSQWHSICPLVPAKKKKGHNVVT